ncbi:type VI secretion system baseplate subunit TssK [Neisseriaceae bacterium PsAf]|nr:type VI secretion system baseplate subunit TssK [Neisseriaceae bacterium PsAf]
MLPKQKVLWVEGMMMEPQHFQEQDRYFENLINKKDSVFAPYPWGFLELEIDHALLEQNKLAIKKTKGIFPDGTPFDMPSNDPLPLPIGLRKEHQGEIVCLVLSLDILGNPYINMDAEQKSNSRYVVVENEVTDRNHGVAQDGTPQSTYVQMVTLNARLVLQKTITGSETVLPICRVKEFSEDGHNIFLDENFLPPLLDFRAIGWLKSSTEEILGIISSRLSYIGEDYFDQSIGNLSELLELLLLQIFNEYKLKLSHLLSLPLAHPERIFFVLLEMLGKISFVPGAEKFRGIGNIVYEHESLHVSFFNLFRSLRGALSLIIESPSVGLQFLDAGDGIYIHQNDPQLRVEKIIFAVSANVPSDKLKVIFPAQTKIGPADLISDLIELQLPGIRMIPLATPPRNVPYYPSSVYFELDNQDDLYKRTLSSVSIALSIVGDFPSLRFDVWGIRERRVK